MNKKLNRAIADAPNGVGIDALLQQFGEGTSRRTLLRRLEAMVNCGEVERIGKARATKYRAIAKTPTHLPRRETRYEMPERETMIVREDTPDAEPTGGDATLRELRDVFREHYSLRKPVGYRREFLDAYVPNQTAYLPASLCEHLRAKGQSAQMAELPPGTYARQVLDRLIIDLTWNSSRLEGSTYSLLETDFLLQQGRSDDPMRHKEARMILNHKAA
ncbi:MAG TPA: cell filamentation protein Fic, partial [Verrucomicrobiales bacterium]|nr:cell filamentation protein Fic [Verrucomicrobiales bacterium]